MESELAFELITDDQVGVEGLSFRVKLSPSGIMWGHVIDELLTELKAHEIDFPFHWTQLKDLLNKQFGFVLDFK